MDKKLDIIAIGECLLELSTNEYFENTKSFNLSFGGDIVSTIVAARRFGASTGIISAVGDDYFKDVILGKLNAEGIDLSNVKICSEKNGLYLCGRSEKKELVTYRRRIAGSSLSLDDYNEEYIKSAGMVYTTGITQSLSPMTNELVKRIFQTAKENDIITAYDPNYSSSFMTTYDTKEYLEDIIENIDILFFSLKSDVDALFELSSVEKIVNYFRDYGIRIIIIKSHQENGYYIYSNGKTEFIDTCCMPGVHSIGSGDVFNGGFLAAVSKGYTPYEAAKIAATQASIYAERKGRIAEIPNYDELLRV